MKGNKQTKERTNEQTNERTNERTNEWMDEGWGRRLSADELGSAITSKYRFSYGHLVSLVFSLSDGGVGCVGENWTMRSKLVFYHASNISVLEVIWANILKYPYLNTAFQSE